MVIDITFNVLFCKTFNGFIVVFTFLFAGKDINQIEIERMLTLFIVMSSNIWKGKNQNMTYYFNNLRTAVDFVMVLQFFSG